jgi:hypothetical protein
MRGLRATVHGQTRCAFLLVRVSTEGASTATCTQGCHFRALGLTSRVESAASYESTHPAEVTGFLGVCFAVMLPLVVRPDGPSEDFAAYSSR